MSASFELDAAAQDSLEPQRAQERKVLGLREAAAVGARRDGSPIRRAKVAAGVVVLRARERQISTVSGRGTSPRAQCNVPNAYAPMATIRCGSPC